jgi:hypothetical protein
MRRMPTLLGIDSLLFFKSLENPFVAILSFVLKKSNSGEGSLPEGAALGF